MQILDQDYDSPEFQAVQITVLVLMQHSMLLPTVSVMQKHISVFRIHCRAPVSLQGLEGASVMGDIPVQPSGTVPWQIIWPLIPVRLQYFLDSAVCVNSTSHSFPPERSTRWWLGFVAHVAALPEAQPGRIRACGVRG